MLSCVGQGDRTSPLPGPRLSRATDAGRKQSGGPVQTLICASSTNRSAARKLRQSGVEFLPQKHPLQWSSIQCRRLCRIILELIANAPRHVFADAGGTLWSEAKGGSSAWNAVWRMMDPAPENIRAGQALGIIQQLVRGLNGGINLRLEARGQQRSYLFRLAIDGSGSRGGSN